MALPGKACIVAHTISRAYGSGEVLLTWVMYKPKSVLTPC